MTLRHMTLTDLETVLGWAADEGWNPGIDDAAAFLAADPEGFFLHEEAGRPLAAISVVAHDPGMAFLGLYICRPEVRGRGIGLALWTEALRHAGSRTVGLDGVAAQQGNYARSGFAPAGATLRLEGRIAPASPLPEAGPEDFDRLARLDRAANGYDRPRFLQAWLQPNPTRRTVILGATGFATARRCLRGCKIGPVIAPDTASALALIRGAAARLDCDEVIVDVPDANPALIAALEAQDFRETFRTARMYRGAAPVARPTLQATGTLELG